MPQVQMLRDLLDNDAAILVVKEREYRAALEKLKQPPNLVVCDSQVVQKTVADTPASVPCTTFSILFSRFKGDLNEMVRGVRAVDRLHDGSKVLIGEACSHHAAEDDIGRVKIPRWLRQYTGADLDVHVHAGCDYPSQIKEYELIVHCGSCTLNRRAMLSRIERAKEAGVPITNYGVCISYSQGVLERALSPFPAALDVFKKSADEMTAGRTVL
jgi:[FeFe] hydrogenase H-cluster maturation GTPase HydF